MPSVDNQIQMLDACSHAEDPEHISEEMNAAHIAQASQESCSITRTGDFLGRRLEMNYLLVGNLASLNSASLPPPPHCHHYHDGHMADDKLSTDDVSCSSSQVSAKSEKNMADFDSEESGCEEELVQIHFIGRATISSLTTSCQCSIYLP